MEVNTKKLIPSGDKDKAISMVHLVDRQIASLKNQMSYNNLKQYSNVWNYPDGSVVKCSSVFGQVTVEAYTSVTPTMGILRKVEPEEIITIPTKYKPLPPVSYTTDATIMDTSGTYGLIMSQLGEWMPPGWLADKINITNNNLQQQIDTYAITYIINTKVYNYLLLNYTSGISPAGEGYEHFSLHFESDPITWTTVNLPFSVIINITSKV